MRGGIGIGSGDTGRGFPNAGIREDLASTPRSVDSSGSWRKTAGVLLVSTPRLTKLGSIISEKTVSRYMPRLPAAADQVKRWIAFLRNHKDDIAAMDLFAVPTASLRLLHGFFVIEHGRRHIVHFNATFHPTSE